MVKELIYFIPFVNHLSYADLSGYGGVGRCTGRHAGQYRISGKLNSFSSSLLSINSLHAYKFLY